MGLGKGKWQEVQGQYFCTLCEKHLNDCTLKSHIDSDAWWKEQGGQTQHMQCSCPGGGDACQCERDAENDGSENVDVVLRHETAQLLSLWWVAHGSGHPAATPNCGHVGTTVCGCRYYGCRCGHAGATGCR